MITRALMDWLSAALQWFFSILPEWTGPEGDNPAGALGTVFQLTGWLNQYFPLDLTLTLMLAGVVWFIALWVIRAVLWGLTKLHIAGGSDS